ncbi:hypothetical protein [Brucella intermedia]|uniref:Uncharacterized protein n=1 Tax=Brucella intermedia M86 TaxID=1234597 RepID=M5JK23_9HYPH|nr:hypothetical protein [Brucella intermedia]ELT46647.1 hypothetical protein D584_23728 [Brucella intermedia M86]
MKRLSPLAGSAQMHTSDFNQLHHACLLWVDYLRAETEVEKQAFLYEAASHLVLVRPRGEEGEEVIQQVWNAIHRRQDNRAYIEGDEGQYFVEAVRDGKFATFRSLADTKIPVQDGIWKSKDGAQLEVYRVQEFSGLLCVWAANVALSQVSAEAQAEATNWNGHLPCDTSIIRGMGPWNYVRQADKLIKSGPMMGDPPSIAR